MLYILYITGLCTSQSLKHQIFWSGYSCWVIPKPWQFGAHIVHILPHTPTLLMGRESHIYERTSESSLWSQEVKVRVGFKRNEEYSSLKLGKKLAWYCMEIVWNTGTPLTFFGKIYCTCRSRCLLTELIIRKAGRTVHSLCNEWYEFGNQQRIRICIVLTLCLCDWYSTLNCCMENVPTHPIFR